MILQHCINHRLALSSQIDFDAVESEMGEAAADAFHSRFYQARASLLRNHELFWLSLNSLYHGAAEALGRVRRNSIIITTKEAEYAHRILSFHNVDWDFDRIICSGKERKLGIVGEYLDSGAAERAILIDDQIDHLTPCPDTRVDVFLASWGFVKPEWLSVRDIPVLALSEFEALLSRFL